MGPGPYADFAILDVFDIDKDYSSWNTSEYSYKELVEHYNAISISDDVINNWWHDLLKMKTYIN